MLLRPNPSRQPCAALLFTAIFLAGGAAWGSAQSGAMPQRNVPPQSLSPVIISERPDAMQSFTADPQQVRQMVNRELLTLTSSTDVATAWDALGITPQDIVGIKISTAGGPGFCTHRALVKAISDGLHAAGLPLSHIIIWDKFQDQMTAAGYAPQAATDTQPAIASVVPDNYDPEVFYKNGMIGSLIWGDFMFSQSLDSSDPDSDRNLTRSYYTKFVTQTCTKLINVPVLSYNQYIGIDACLSGLALGSTDNNRRIQGPPTYGDPGIDEILFRSFFRRKVVVHILDALVAPVRGRGRPSIRNSASRSGQSTSGAIRWPSIRSRCPVSTGCARK